ncbi:pancreatic triacylglycerol lipase [Brachionus plicatilis]|uniref:Pancreatic triacylglycerol lipase n=1 Tax=Brachionus plicatilis TaxID=10195 RepID=A0A3M7S118_BRAPC|nr:pancreatic triacylglycerol lipase [Brachionus plicatilis]
MIIYLLVIFISQILAIGDCILIYFYSTITPFDPVVIDPGTNISSNQNLQHIHKALSSKACIIYLIVHGFGSSGQDDWVMDMKDRLLYTAPCVQVFAMDWSERSTWKFDLNIGYVQSIQNIPKTSELFGETLSALSQLNNSSLFLKNIHCIGHSLGAHMCGFISKYIKLKKGVVFKRISGLDPAGPCFEDSRPEKRLSSQDANYVDVIHTSVNLGIQTPIGHSDYYVNDAKTQPGCLKTNEIRLPVLLCKEPMKKSSINRILVNVFDLVKCSHSKAHEYFIDSILSKCAKFDAFRCDNYESFLSKKCFHCHTNKMGFNSETELKDGIKRIYFLDYTNSDHEITAIEKNLSPNVCESVQVKYFDFVNKNESFFLNVNNLEYFKEFRNFCSGKNCSLNFVIEGYKSKKRSNEWLNWLRPDGSNNTNFLLIEWSDIQNLYTTKEKSVANFKGFLKKFVKNMGHYFSKDLIKFNCIGGDETAMLMCNSLTMLLEENLPYAISDHYHYDDMYSKLLGVSPKCVASTKKRYEETGTVSSYVIDPLPQ